MSEKIGVVGASWPLVPATPPALAWTWISSPASMTSSLSSKTSPPKLSSGGASSYSWGKSCLASSAPMSTRSDSSRNSSRVFSLTASEASALASWKELGSISPWGSWKVTDNGSRLTCVGTTLPSHMKFRECFLSKRGGCRCTKEKNLVLQPFPKKQHPSPFCSAFCSTSTNDKNRFTKLRNGPCVGLLVDKLRWGKISWNSLMVHQPCCMSVSGPMSKVGDCLKSPDLLSTSRKSSMWKQPQTTGGVLQRVSMRVCCR